MLTVDLRDLRRGPMGWEEQVAVPGEVWADIGARFLGPVDLAMRAEAASDGSVHVTGRLAGAFAVLCRRCLTEVEQPVAIPLDVWFRPDPESAAEEAVFPLPVETRKVDLVPALREELLFAVPAFPLCRPECEGLCPKCGAPRATGSCGCSFQEPDPRWDALRALR